MLTVQLERELLKYFENRWIKAQQFFSVDRAARFKFGDRCSFSREKQFFLLIFLFIIPFLHLLLAADSCQKSPSRPVRRSPARRWCGEINAFFLWGGTRVSTHRPTCEACISGRTLLIVLVPFQNILNPEFISEGAFVQAVCLIWFC